jgi:hypothetical protein
VADPIRRRIRDLHVEELLRNQTGLRLRPVVKGELRFVGSLTFSADAPGWEPIVDRYEVEVTVPPDFPEGPALVRETGGRIPKDFHTNPDGTLCLGSPTRLRLALLGAPTLPGFIDRCVVPFLYGFSHREKHGSLPFGELAHGLRGLRQDYAEFLGVGEESVAVDLLRLGTLKKRRANKLPCPCGSNRRLGRCHHLMVNRLRDELGRKWLLAEHGRL